MSATNVELPKTFKIDGVDAVFDTMKASLAGEGAIEIDGSGVEVVDFAALQLLMAFAVQCKSSSRELAFAKVSEPLSVAIKDAGAGEVLSVA